MSYLCRRAGGSEFDCETWRLEAATEGPQAAEAKIVYQAHVEMWKASIVILASQLVSKPHFNMQSLDNAQLLT